MSVAWHADSHCCASTAAARVANKSEMPLKHTFHEVAAVAGTIGIGDLTVNRWGFGAMRLCGDSAWGRPKRIWITPIGFCNGQSRSA